MMKYLEGKKKKALDERETSAKTQWMECRLGRAEDVDRQTVTI